MDSCRLIDTWLLWRSIEKHIDQKTGSFRCLRRVMWKWNRVLKTSGSLIFSAQFINGCSVWMCCMKYSFTVSADWEMQSREIHLPTVESQTQSISGHQRSDGAWTQLLLHCCLFWSLSDIEVKTETKEFKHQREIKYLSLRLVFVINNKLGLLVYGCVFLSAVTSKRHSWTKWWRQQLIRNTCGLGW